MAKPRVLIVDDEPIVLRQISEMVRAEFGLQVVGACCFGTAREQVEGTQLDGALVDLRLGDESGIRLLDQCRTRQPDVALGLMTGGDMDMHLQNEVGALGAILLRKPFPPRMLSASALAARRAFGSSRSSFVRAVGGRHLTPREGECLRLAAAGLTSSRISERLGIGVTTVRTHIRRALAKSDVSTLAELREYCEVEY